MSLLRNTSIKYKLLLAFYLLTIIPSIFMQYLYYHKSSEIIKTKSINYSQDLLKIIEYKIDNFCASIIKKSDDLLFEPRVYSALNINKIKNFEDIDYIDYLKVEREASEALRDITLSSNEIRSICIVSLNKKFYYYDSNNMIVNIKEDIPYEHILETARKADGRPIWYVDRKNNDVKNIYLVRIIKDKNTFEEAGMLAILINNNYLEWILNEQATDTMKNLAIISQEGEVLCHNYKDKNLVNKFNINMLNMKRGNYIDRNTNALISFTTLTNTNWGIINHIPVSELYKEIKHLRNILVILCICTLVIVSMVSLLIAVDILNPIQNLVGAMQKIEKQGVYEEIAVDRNDELGYLSRTFNEMSNKINHLVKWVYEEQITRKEAEIKALQAQINPHFLFNALESINWMAQLNGIPEVSETVSALSSLMEVNIGRDNKLISLGDELKYIDDYVFIVEKRYCEKLRVFRDIDENALDLKVPGLLIQPLVENAIKHGVEKGVKNAEIRINVFKDNNHVTIEIIDNGNGIEEEKLAVLNERFKRSNSSLADHISSSNRKGIGLQNVNRRIKLFYGEEYGLKIESAYKEYTKVIVRLPYKLNLNTI